MPVSNVLLKHILPHWITGAGKTRRWFMIHKNISTFGFSWPFFTPHLFFTNFFLSFPSLPFALPNREQTTPKNHRKNCAWRTETLVSSPSYKSIMRLTIFNIQHSDFGIYKCVGRFRFRLFGEGSGAWRPTPFDAWQYFNFWHHLIFITFHIFSFPTAAKNPRGDTESSIRLYCEFFSFDDEAKNSFDGWPLSRGFRMHVLPSDSGHLIN